MAEIKFVKLKNSSLCIEESLSQAQNLATFAEIDLGAKTGESRDYPLAHHPLCRGVLLSGNV